MEEKLKYEEPAIEIAAASELVKSYVGPRNDGGPYALSRLQEPLSEE